MHGERATLRRRRWQRWRRRCRRRAASGVLVAGLAAVSGCAQEVEGGLGVGDLPEVPAAPDAARAMLADGVDRTIVAESVDLSLTADVGLAGFQLDYDWTAGGVGEIEGTERSFGGASEVEIRSDGTTAWIRSDSPAFRDGLPPGASWMEGRPDQILTDGSLTAIDGMWAFFLFLRGAKSIEAGGIEWVEGVDVRMVSGTIDAEAAREVATIAEQQMMDNAFHSTEEGERFEFEAGIGSDGRIHHLDYTISSSEDEGLGSEMRVRIDVRRFDQEVEAPDPPPAGETVSIDDVPGAAEALDDD